MLATIGRLPVPAVIGIRANDEFFIQPGLNKIALAYAVIAGSTKLGRTRYHAHKHYASCAPIMS